MDANKIITLIVIGLGILNIPFWCWVTKDNNL